MVHSPLMIERYHLTLAAQALVVGLIAAAFDQWAPEWMRNRVVAAAGLAAGFLGAWGNPRALPWLIPALLLVIPADQPARSHALGSWTLPMAVLSLAGVWSAVPDTEAPLAAACVLAPLALGGAASGRTVGPVASASLVVSIIGAAWVGSAGWGAALAPCVAVGMIGVAPVVLGLRPTGMGSRSTRVLLVAHTPVALLVPRVVAFRSVPAAIAIDLAVVIVLVLVARAAQPSTP